MAACIRFECLSAELPLFFILARRTCLIKPQLLESTGVFSFELFLFNHYRYKFLILVWSKSRWFPIPQGTLAKFESVDSPWWRSRGGVPLRVGWPWCVSRWRPARTTAAARVWVSAEPRGVSVCDMRSAHAHDCGCTLRNWRAPCTIRPDNSQHR